MSSNSSTLKQDAFGLATQGSGPTQERNLVRCLRTGGSMRPTLKIGAKGPDVVRLQTRLNALPSARARLAVNGIFDKNTLRRVKEFQTNTFVDGVVDANDWDALLGNQPEERDTFFTDGRVLRDPNGNELCCAASTSRCWTTGVSPDRTDSRILGKPVQTRSGSPGTSTTEVLSVRLTPLPTSISF